MLEQVRADFLARGETVSADDLADLTRESGWIGPQPVAGRTHGLDAAIDMLKRELGLASPA